MNVLARKRVIALVAALTVLGCTAEAPPTNVPTPTGVPAPADVAATLAWLEERTFECEERPAPAATRRWECTGVSTWPDESRNLLSIRIDRDDHGGTRVGARLDATETLGKELCPGAICDGYTGFFSDTIALSPITGPQGAEIGTWIDAHPTTGGPRQFGAISVLYTPTRPIMTLTVDIAPAP